MCILEVIDYVLTILSEPKYTREELVDWVQTHITNEQKYNEAMECIESLVDYQKQSIEFSTEMLADKNLLKKIIGYHVIAFSVKANY